MSEIAANIRELVADAPTLPGCYLWKNEENQTLYIGKAINLRNRLRNYLRPEDPKTRALMSKARGLEWITTETGTDALVLEANLVKKHTPHYNVRLKDDKRYPYICVSLAEPYPRVFITRKIKNDKNRYFGPYTDVRATRNTLDLIHKIFPIRKTPLKLPLKKPQRPCMNFHIKRCLGPCQGNVPTEEYAELVKEIVLFLEGRREILEGLVAKRMTEYSEKLEYEKAGMYRDILSNIRRATERQSVMSPGGGDEDIIACARRDEHAQIVLLEVRGGRVLGRKSFPLTGADLAQDGDIISGFMRDYYLGDVLIPTRILTQAVLPDRKQIAEYISSRVEHEVKILTPHARETRSMLKMAGKNAELLLSERLLAVRRQDRRNALEEIKTMLHLERTPDVMECYDISHFQGTEPVASGVMFVDGHPYKSGYRRYRIKTIEGINDPAMIGEAVARRIQRLQNEDKSLPDLIVIDGGFTQLSAACESAAALGAGDLPMIGLAKKFEEIYVPGDPAPHRYDANSPGLRLLRHLRDEAHRFGVSFHRERRNKLTMQHLVEKIPDIGPERKKALLKHLGEKDVKLEEAGVETLQEVPGIGTALAGKIHAYLQAVSGER